jgi:peptidoglycan L-alanyl-D-glutamate endopeptidase CwlK
MNGKFALSQASWGKLAGVNPDLIKVVDRALQYSLYDFKVTEGLRSHARQIELVKAGKSRTVHSKHLIGDAVDIAVLDKDGCVTWNWEHYETVSRAFKRAARELRVPLVWGGDWEKFRDGPHYQIGV